MNHLPCFFSVPDQCIEDQEQRGKRNDDAAICKSDKADDHHPKPVSYTHLCRVYYGRLRGAGWGRGRGSIFV